MARSPKTHIFISYRRAIDAAFALSLYNFLSKQFDPSQIFMDIHTIKPGENFVDAIERSVSTCDALIAIIGEKWLKVLEERPSDVEDYVKAEIASALSANVAVIPVLIDNAEMPSEKLLPQELVSLTHLNAIRIRNDSFDYDARKLGTYLRKEFHLIRGLGPEALAFLIFAMVGLFFLSLVVVTDPNIRVVFVVLGAILTVSILYGINLLLKPVYLPWRYLLYLLVPLIAVILLAVSSYTLQFMNTPANAMAPNLISYGDALPTLGSYASNARLLKLEADSDEQYKFVRMKFQLICPYMEGRCDAGIILGGLNGIRQHRQWKELVFNIRGAFGNEVVGVSLKDALQIEPRVFDISGFIEGGEAVTVDWQSVHIPLTYFQGIDLSELRLITFFVDADYSPDQVVEFDIADLHFE